MTLSWIAAVLISSSLMQVDPAGPVGEGRGPGGPSAPTAPEDWAAIEHGLRLIRGCQMPDGMIRMKADADLVWAVPYFGNYAAMALLAAHRVRPNPGDLRRAEHWLVWYAGHQEPDGTISDREGTLRTYRSTGRRDSTDAYAGTFLMAVARYGREVPGRPRPEVITAGRKALSVLRSLAQPDGLMIARPDHPVKYLIDNLEDYGGLHEAAQFFTREGLAEEADLARALADRLRAGMGRFWSASEGCYAYALDQRGMVSGGLTRPYPHGLAQLYALACIRPVPPGLWPRVHASFRPGDEGMPAERWLLAATACPEAQGVEQFRRSTREQLLRFTATNVYVERPAFAILALLDRYAHFPPVEIAGRR
jgi:hypothetical protein